MVSKQPRRGAQTVRTGQRWKTNLLERGLVEGEGGAEDGGLVVPRAALRVERRGEHRERFRLSAQAS